MACAPSRPRSARDGEHGRATTKASDRSCGRWVIAPQPAVSLGRMESQTSLQTRQQQRARLSRLVHWHGLKLTASAVGRTPRTLACLLSGITEPSPKTWAAVERAFRELGRNLGLGKPVQSSATGRTPELTPHSMPPKKTAPQETPLQAERRRRPPTRMKSAPVAGFSTSRHDTGAEK